MLMVTSRPVRLRSPSIIISCEASNESIDGAASVIEVRVLLLVLITTNRYSIYTMGYRQAERHRPLKSTFGSSNLPSPVYLRDEQHTNM